MNNFYNKMMGNKLLLFLSIFLFTINIKANYTVTSAGGSTWTLTSNACGGSVSVSCIEPGNTSPPVGASYFYSSGNYHPYTSSYQSGTGAFLSNDCGSGSGSGGSSCAGVPEPDYEILITHPTCGESNGIIEIVSEDDIWIYTIEPTIENPSPAGPYTNYTINNVAAKPNNSSYKIQICKAGFYNDDDFFYDCCDWRYVKLIEGTTLEADIDASNNGAITCVNSSVELSAFPSNATYQWTGPNGFSSAQQNPTVFQSGIYSVTVTQNGCVGTSSITVLEDTNPPNIAASNTGPLTCTNSNVQLSATNGVTYSWSGPNGFTSNLQNPTVTNPGSYGVSVVGANGCTDFDFTQVEADLDTPTASAIGGEFCTGESFQLSASGGGTYLWSGPDGFNSSMQNPEVNVPGTYNLTVTAENGCTDQTSATVTETIIDSGITVADQVCANEPLVFSIINAGFGSTYSWDFGTGATPINSNNPNQTVTWTSPGVKNVALTVELNGCSEIYNAEILVTEEVFAVAGDDRSICQGETTQLGGTPTGPDGAIYVWSPATGLNSTSVANPMASPLSTTTYTVSVTKDGCVNTAQVTVFVGVEECQIDLELTKMVDKPQVNVGEEVVWTITVNNQGPADATGVTVTDALPAGLTLVNVNTNDGTFDSNTLTWTIGNLTIGQSTTLSLTTTVDQVGSFTNTAQVATHDQEDIDSNPGNDNGDQSEDDEDNAVVIATPQFIDLELTKTVDKPQVNVGEEVVWTITVLNEGPAIATGVSVGDFLPNGVTYLNSSVSQGDLNSNNLIWTIGTIGVNESVSLDITTSVDQAGSFENKAEIISANENDIDSTPNNMNGGPNEDDEDNAITTAETILGSLGNLVFLDLDEDGIQDANEPGIQGVVVMLLDGNGNMLEQMSTDANGNYLFDELPAGDYKVKFPIEASEDGINYTLTAPNQGFNDEVDSDAIAMTDGSGNAMTQIYTLDEGENNLTVDAGYVIVPEEIELAGLGNFTFLDYDDNGMYDPITEDPLKNITVYLYDANDLNAPIDSTITDINGYYEFINLNPNLDYVVQFGESIGATRSSPNFPSSEGDDDKNDADFFTGFTDIIDLDPGEFDPTIDAGYVPFRGVQGLAVLQGPAIQMGEGKPGTTGTNNQFKSVDLGWQMIADLVKEDLVPLTDPYSNLATYTHINNDFGLEAANPDLLNYTGEPDDIVDWVFVELRDMEDPKTVITTRSVLLQANGQLVDKTGSPNIELNAEYGQYYVALRHRNHLGVMTANPVTIGGIDIPMIDFTDPSVTTWGTHAQAILDNETRALWAGDVNMDGTIIFQGESNDNTDGFFDVLSDPNNVSSQVTYIANGYLNSDINLSCQSIYQGSGNDNDKKFFNILLHPQNTLGVLNFIIEEQLEK